MFGTVRFRVSMLSQHHYFLRPLVIMKVNPVQSLRGGTASVGQAVVAVPGPPAPPGPAPGHDDSVEAVGRGGQVHADDAQAPLAAAGRGGGREGGRVPVVCSVLLAVAAAVVVVHAVVGAVVGAAAAGEAAQDRRLGI